MSVSICCIMASFETEQDILPLVSSGLEVRGPDREICEARPDEVAGICEDIGSCLQWAVACTFWETCKGCNEDVATLNVCGGRDGDVELWRGKIRTGFELPVCGNEWNGC